MLAKHFSNELRYSPSTHFICYTEHYRKETEPGVQAVAHELTHRQLKEATKEKMQEAIKKMEERRAQTILDGISKAKAEQQCLQGLSLRQCISGVCALRCRNSKYINATLKELHPMPEISLRDLDADCFAICTPAATYDLRKGLAGAREHSQTASLPR